MEKNPEILDVNPWRFCGEYFDREADTLYLRARHYDPRTGRFGAEDSAGDGLNWYTYCGNNPVGRIDPSGESWEDFWGDAKNFWNGFVSSQNMRWEDLKNDPSFMHFADWMTYGMLSTNGARYNQASQSGNAYDYANWLLSGTPDMLQGTFNPDKPLSFDHWMNSFGTATLVYGGYKGVQNIKANAVSPYGSPTPDAVWDSWGNYEKVTVNGQTYARVGDTLYSRHAVDRMQPSGLRYSTSEPFRPAGGFTGRSVAPGYANYVLDSVSPVYDASYGTWVYNMGTITVYTNPQGQVVSIITK